MKITFDHSENIAKDIYTFWFKPKKHFSYIPGQFVELILKHPDKDRRGEKRWFTLSSSPTEELLTISTKITESSSSFKKALVSLHPGDQAVISALMGDFVLPEDTELPLLFVAGGIGCTPYRSMLQYLADKAESRQITLIYAANTKDEVAYRSLFNNLGSNFKIVLSNPGRRWSGPTGKLDAKLIHEQLDSTQNPQIYVSGPRGMIESVVKELKLSGIARKRIKTDYFPDY
jgi:glycine betaine catabolism B